MEHTVDRIENEKIILSSLSKMFSMFQIRCYYKQGHYDQNIVENIAIKCSNCEKEKMISMDNINTTYQDIITSFVLNIVIQHFGMLWIIFKNQHLEYDMYKHNSDWMTGGTW